MASIPSSSDRWPSELLLFVAASRYCVHIGQFARLLPALAVVAIFQAPSPESNPDSLSPVRAIVVHCTTVKADRSEVHVIKHACCGDATNKRASADVLKGPVWLCSGHTAIAWRWSFTRLGAIHHGQPEPKPMRPTSCGRLFHACISHQVLEGIQWAAGQAAIRTLSQRWLL